MKKTVMMIVMALAVTCGAVEVPERLLDAIAKVESNNNPRAEGDRDKNGNPRAIGMYQIWKIYVDDVNRMSSKKFTYEDRWDARKSREMVRIYIEFYSRHYERTTGRKATVEVMARMHNGGPSGWCKDGTRSYWRKIKAAGRFE